MTEAEWLACEKPLWLLHFFKKYDRPPPSDRALCLLAMACCGSVVRRGSAPDLERAVRTLGDFADNRLEGDDLGQVQRNLAPLVPPVLRTADDMVLAAVYYAVGRIELALVFEAVHEAMKWAQEAARLGCGAGTWDAERELQVAWARDIFGNPFRPVIPSPDWRTTTSVSIARGMYESKDFSAMPILADALQDAGCNSADVLTHCRGPGPHVRGCWVVDLVLGKE